MAGEATGSGHWGAQAPRLPEEEITSEYAAASIMSRVARFSERHGYVQPRSLVQRDALDEPTRVAIWNVIAMMPGSYTDSGDSYNHKGLAEHLWTSHFGRARDEFPGIKPTWMLVKASILGDAFPSCMDTIEETLDGYRYNPPSFGANSISDFEEVLNNELERNLVGYRVIDRQLVPLESAEEVEAVAGAITAAEPRFAVARTHLSQALNLLSDRANPDYRNSIKESISAVESLARTITGRSTLGEALKALPSLGLPSHQALLRAWSSMYGWSSDAGGLRHGSEQIEAVDQALAKYILVISSAFVSYLLQKASNMSAEQPRQGL